MSLEDLLREHISAIKANTEAKIANTEAVTKHNELLTTAINTAAAKNGTAAASTATPKAGKAKADKPPPAPTHESLKTTIGAWIGEKPAKSAEQGERTAAVKKLLEHFGAAKLPDVPGEKLTEFGGMFDQIKAGEDPFPADAETETEEDSIL